LSQAVPPGRIVVVGPAGSGKSTLARRLAVALGSPVLELDSIFWQPGWTRSDSSTFITGIATFVNRHDSWVVDGNYFDMGAPDVAWPLADVVVWLDLPRLLVATRSLRRITVETLRRRTLWEGTVARFGNPLRPTWLPRYAWRQVYRHRARYVPAMADPTGPTWVRLRTPREVEDWAQAFLAGAQGAEVAG
jgi:adenylate kinase family enzyme